MLTENEMAAEPLFAIVNSECNAESRGLNLSTSIGVTTPEYFSIPPRYGADLIFLVLESLLDDTAMRSIES